MNDGSHDKLEKPVCDCCAFGHDEFIAQQDKLMKKFGWVANFITDGDVTPFGINYHTHGVQESFGHKDFQVCFPLPYETIHTIITKIVDMVKDGKKFIQGQKVSNIIRGEYQITFIDATENNRQVLRVIFPDPTGNLDKDTIEEPYSDQYL